MLVARSSALTFWVLFLTTASTVAGFMVSPGGYLSPLATQSLLGATGGIHGRVSIGPLFPVCRVIESAGSTASYYNQIQVVVTPSSGLALTVPVNWITLEGCWASGTFKIGLNPGIYSLTITSCYAVYSDHYLGPAIPFCPGLPKTALVESGTWTQVDISIGTGIE